MKNIIHLIPSKVIGGAEIAAETTKDIKSDNFTFEVFYLSSISYSKSIILSLFSVIQIFRNTYKLIKKNPDVLIVSLWKSCIAAYIISKIKTDIKIILFLHLPISSNKIDFFLTKLISRKAFQIWADSERTLKNRSEELKVNPKISKKIISFKRLSIEENIDYVIKPKFIFWGRIHKQKRIDKAIKLIHKIILSGYLDTEFLIIGPDCGEKNKLFNLVNSLGIKKNVVFKKEKSLERIIDLSKNYSFFLQLSDYEGMGMSVIESMQLGLIPVITNVGEISQYCNNKKNSIVFENMTKTSQYLIKLINNPKIFKQLRKEAISTWINSLTYKEDMKCNLELLSKNIQ